MANGLATRGSVSISEKTFMGRDLVPLAGGAAVGALLVQGAMTNWAPGDPNDDTKKDTLKAAAIAAVGGYVLFKLLGRWDRKAAVGALFGGVSVGLLRVADDYGWTEKVSDWFANHDGNPDNDVADTSGDGSGDGTSGGGGVFLGTRLRQYYQDRMRRSA